MLIHHKDIETGTHHRGQVPAIFSAYCARFWIELLLLSSGFFLQGLQHALGSDGHLGEAAAGRIVDRVGDGGGAGNHCRLADTTGAIGAGLLGMLNAHGDEGLGGIIDGGDLVVHEGLIEDFTILELQLLEQYSTQSLHHTALYLSLIQLGVDDVTGVAALYHLLYFDDTGLGIDLNLGAGYSGGPERGGLGGITGSGDHS